ncbi:PAS domain-containing protein [Aestuariibacter salexigens]|uniref:PAS domain-containing protein n=1 Tax=Aestuariibacter salexigens TaxID=226010 RepID=UPI00047BC662|nr:PAS domain-containing protein [Aestuariibacter salexigens]
MSHDTEEMLFLSALLVDIKPLKVIRQLLSMSISPILITDAGRLDSGYRIIYANRAFCRLTGYELAELVGQSPRIFQGKDSHKETIQRLGRKLKETGYFRGTSVNYRKDGSAYPLEWDISPIRDEQGKIKFFISIQRDLSMLVGVAEQFKDINESARHFIHHVKTANQDDESIVQETTALLNKLKDNAMLYSSPIFEDDAFFDFDAEPLSAHAANKKAAMSASEYLQKENLTKDELSTLLTCISQLEEDIALLSSFPNQQQRFGDVESTFRELSDAIFFLVEFTDTALALQEVADCMATSDVSTSNRMIIEFLHSLLNELDGWIRSVFVDQNSDNVHEGAGNIVSSAKQIAALLRA